MAPDDNTAMRIFARYDESGFRLIGYKALSVSREKADVSRMCKRVARRNGRMCAGRRFAEATASGCLLCRAKGSIAACLLSLPNCFEPKERKRIMALSETLEYKLKMLPNSPGCYLMKRGGEIIYVGKAKNLKNRVRQYFHSAAGHTPKVAAMVPQIDDFDIILCQTNFEALTLECNLIKKHRPYYNILLKDDKHYPYLRLNTEEAYPRLTVARTIDAKDGAKYFGPYYGATSVRQVLEEVRRYFPLRTCSLALPLSKPHRPCVHHQIGQCLAPCAGHISQGEYGEVLRGVVAFLNGDTKTLLRELTGKMDVCSARMEFEQAAVYRDKITDIHRMMERQHAIQTRDTEQDVIAVATGESDAMIQITHIRAGRMEGSRSFLLERCGEENPGDLIAGFMMQYYDDTHLIPRDILAQCLPEGEEELEEWLRGKRGGAVTLAVPRRGEKRDLVQLGYKNAQDALKKHDLSRRVRRARTIEAMETLGEALGMADLPRRIEGFDISNTQGAQSVASMVVFENGEPAKKEYRHFRIKTVEGANDFASMAEVIGRRFTHGLQEKREREEAGLPVEEGRFSKLPDVILIDGGPQQLFFAHRAMKEAGGNVPMFGLAKRNEEIYLPGREIPIVLDKRSTALHLIQYVRDEAHRFGITRHRALREKSGMKSELAAIEGIGPKRQVELLRHFGSVAAIFAAPVQALADVTGMNTLAAENIRRYAENRGKKR